jgi:hypothetical protein
VNTATPDQWHDGANGSFLTSIGCAWADHVAVYYHDNQLWSDETSSWRTVEEEGTDFLEALLDLTEHQKVGVETVKPLSNALRSTPVLSSYETVQ